jgi:hypothetical protein
LLALFAHANFDAKQTDDFTTAVWKKLCLNSAGAVPAVLGALADAGLGVTSVTVGRPSLDDVYLRHVGRSFEVAA